MKKLLFIGFISAGVLFSCNNSADKTGSTDSWPQTEVDAFMENCVKGAETSLGEKAKDYCTCMLGKVQEKYPTPADAMKLNMEEVMELAEGCK